MLDLVEKLREHNGLFETSGPAPAFQQRVRRLARANGFSKERWHNGATNPGGISTTMCCDDGPWRYGATNPGGTGTTMSCDYRPWRYVSSKE